MTPMNVEARAPATLWIIALVALGPFPIAGIIYAYGPAILHAGALEVVLTWAAVVLAFLGGVRWGLETARPRPRALRLLGSVVSPVAAWTLWLARDAMGPVWLMAGFLVAFMLQWTFDHAAPDVPSRYPRLSTALTAGACLSLAVMIEAAIRM